MSQELTLLQRRVVLGPAYRLFYEHPVHVVRGQDVWLEDAEGRRYLDAYNNVPVVGHANVKVVAAMTEQALKVNTHTRYLNENVVDYAERLLALFPAELNRVVFTCTGSEANDLALRIAHDMTGRKGVIVTANAYHGVTSLLADMSPSLRPVGDYVEVVPSPLSFVGTPDEINAQFSEAIDLAAERLDQRGTPVCALLIDTVFASDGLYLPSRGVIRAAAEAVRRHGGLFIADEVQGGFARVGGNWWAFMQDDVVPDIVTLGKPMGNGHPIGAVVVKDALLDEFGKQSRYFNTFGGNTVSAAVGLAVLSELKRINATEQALHVGRLMEAGLKGIAQDYATVGAVRGSGLYWSVELTPSAQVAEQSATLAAAIVNGLREDGVLIGTCGNRNHILKIRPPLTFRPEHVELFIQALRRQFTSLDLQ
ncbi:aspartate aminotransferase family protein [Paenalcaligenes niemegkensis]|uniref:aspartate aminotransferase family protein n=1 Tax=Paenalcaligenes niemegkensis TaxID=2895469 RepID=UPI001EE84817|nr:aspartate aminotransferase family protein [Paenalcaligenes niemegkensis]MCQ9618145.1 aspartate aminotransferase family protein [Paenalcaligenes niemegkensis]